MSDNQMAELYDRLVKARSEAASADRVFLRGWNAAIDCAIRHLKFVGDEAIEDEGPSILKELGREKAKPSPPKP